jgi:hypothetical protein
MIKNIKGTKVGSVSSFATPAVVASVRPQHLAMRARGSGDHEHHEEKEQEQYPPHSGTLFLRKAPEPLRKMPDRLPLCGPSQRIGCVRKPASAAP